MYEIQNEHLPEWGEPRYTDDGFVVIRTGGLYYAPSGHSWTWGNKKFLAVGGALSLYKGIEGKSQWPEEDITDEQVARACEVGKVDVMFTHDIPTAIDIVKAHILAGFNSFHIIPELMHTRDQLNKVFQTVQPRYLFHGHYHIRYNLEHHDYWGFDTRVSGLGMNGDGVDSFTVLDIG